MRIRQEVKSGLPPRKGELELDRLQAQIAETEIAIDQGDIDITEGIALIEDLKRQAAEIIGDDPEYQRCKDFSDWLQEAA